MHLVPAGDRALLVELGDVSAAELHAANARASALPGVTKSIPGHSSLYVIFNGTPNAEALRIALTTASNHQPATSNRTHSVPVQFDGEDLEELLARVHLTPDAFLARVDGLPLIARYLGFRGGFAYLDGWPEEWALPRRATSRPVRRGAFAIAGSVAAFYPIDTPGGWNLLGHTSVDLENAITAGDTLILRVAESLPEPTPRRREVPPIHLPHAPLALWTHTPFDTIAAAIANEAVGNDATAPLFECPLAGPRMRFTHDAVVAWCTPSLDVHVERVGAGDERTFGRVTGGLRAYLALGHREGPVRKIPRGDRHVIAVLPGPHDIHLGTLKCEVMPQLDRVGIRVRPLHPLGVQAPADLRSIGMQCGTIQLHPDGTLVAMGPDHPITGGYLQPLTVLSAERWKLAQLTPGDRITFTKQ